MFNNPDSGNNVRVWSKPLYAPKDNGTRRPPALEPATPPPVDCHSPILHQALRPCFEPVEIVSNALLDRRNIEDDRVLLRMRDEIHTVERHN